MPSDCADSVDQRIVEAAAVHREGVVTGWAALHWMGARWFERSTDPVPISVNVGHGGGEQSDLVATTQEFLHHREVLHVGGLRVTTPLRSVSFEMRYAQSLLRAVQYFDMAAYDDLVSAAELAQYCWWHLPRQTGVGRVRDALNHVHENAWSPLEVTMRWMWLQARPSEPLLCNVPIFSPRGVHLATPDLLDAEAGVVGEYEGQVHLVGERRAADLRRDETLRDAGLEIVTMVGPDVHDPGGFLRRLRGAYERADARTAPPRWSIRPPPWWIDTSSVAARRALTDSQVDRLLAYRRAA